MSKKNTTEFFMNELNQKGFSEFDGMIVFVNKGSKMGVQCTIDGDIDTRIKLCYAIKHFLNDQMSAESIICDVLEKSGKIKLTDNPKIIEQNETDAFIHEVMRKAEELLNKDKEG